MLYFPCMTLKMEALGGQKSLASCYEQSRSLLPRKLPLVRPPPVTACVTATISIAHLSLKGPGSHSCLFALASYSQGKEEKRAL